MGKKKGKGAKKKKVDETKILKALEPVYDTLEEGSATTVLRQAQSHQDAVDRAMQMLKKLERKLGEHPLILSLKACLLWDVGKPGEANKALSKIISDRPTSPMTLRHLVPTTFRLLERLPPICELWEECLKTNELDHEALFQAFHLFGTAFEFKKQQKLTQRLMKTCPPSCDKTRFRMWSVCALECFLKLKDKENKTPMTDRPMARLGQSLLEREICLQEEKAPEGYDDQFFLMLLRFLDLRNKWEHVLAVIDTPRGKQYKDQNELNQWRLKALQKTKNWKLAVKTCREALAENPDHYDAITTFCESMANLDPPTGGKAAAREFLLNLSNKHPKLRGPRLGLCDIEMRLGDSAGLRDELLSFYNACGRTRAWFLDALSYLKKLEAEDLEKLRKEVQASFEAMPLPLEDDTTSKKIAHLRWRISAAFLDYFCEPWTSREKLAEMLDHWRAVCVPGGDETKGMLRDSAKKIFAIFASEKEDFKDESPADDLLLLTTWGALNCWRVSGENDHFKSAKEVLHDALKHSRNNYMFKWALIRLLCHPDHGSTDEADALYSTMKIDSVQWESLGHLIYYDAVRYGNFKLANRVGSERLSMQKTILESHERFSREAYEKNVLEKVVDFAEFTDKARRSRFYQIILIESKVFMFLRRRHNKLEPVQNLLETIRELLEESTYYGEWVDNEDHHTLMPQLWHRPTPGTHGTGHPSLDTPLSPEDILFTRPPPSSLVACPDLNADTSKLTPRSMDKLFRAHFDIHVARLKLLRLCVHLDPDNAPQIEDLLVQFKDALARLEAHPCLNPFTLSAPKRRLTSVFHDCARLFETHLVALSAVKAKTPEAWASFADALRKIDAEITPPYKSIRMGAKPNERHDLGARRAQEVTTFVMLSLDTLAAILLNWSQLLQDKWKAAAYLAGPIKELRQKEHTAPGT